LKARKHRAVNPSVTRERAGLLKGAGVTLSFALGGRKNTPQQKGAVTRAWKKYRIHLAPRTGTVPAKFVPLSKAQLRVAKKFYAPTALTKGGLFIQPPKGVPARDYKVTVNTRTKRVEVRSPRKKVFDEIVGIKPTDILRDPTAAIKKTLAGMKNVRQVQIMVNGFQGKNTYSPKDALLYFKFRLLPSLRKEFKEEGRRLTKQIIVDTFQLKVIHGTPRKKSSKR
jgi:hypothetical protein